VVGEFARTGWLPFPPLSELQYSPGVGVDYYLWSLQLSGIGTLIGGINLLTTILKTRAPGMSYWRMPIFTWTSLASNLLIVASFPILTATLAMLLLDRYLGFHFFTNEAGGNPMMFMNLIWLWGHPEVYILVLPAFGVYSEVVAAFSSKPLFGRRSMIIATMAICILAFTVWLHHFFTMGGGGDVNGVFGIASMLIAIPTGVKVFNWLFTMYQGRVRFSTAMHWAIGFMVTFVIGGMTGVLLAVPPADFVLHNSMFLVAHFHNVIIPGVLFGAFAGYTFWFPKAFGFPLDERLGKAAFWCWFVGFYITFVPLYIVGLEGMTRRLQHYDQPQWHPWLLVSMVGALLVFCGIALQVTQFVVSIRTRERRKDPSGDLWDARSLEWSTSSPPPLFNFAVLPKVNGDEPYWEAKIAAREHAQPDREPDYEPIEVPRNSATGVVTAFFAVVVGFALIWHIWWMAGLGLAGSFATFVVFAWRDVSEQVIPAAEVARIDRKNREARTLVLGETPA
jgi:cytochrome o ubiquinol oxidase subunit 1